MSDREPMGGGEVVEGAPMVLLVEDSPTQALRTRAVLASGGFEVEVCGSGESALNVTLKRQPDLILLDMNLPDMDGREVAQRLKSDPTSAGIPIIFLTGVFREVQDLIEALEGGGDDYLLKPVEDGELLARVKASVRAKRVQRTLGQLVRILLSVNQVGNQIAGILDRDHLLDSLVKLLRENFDYSIVNLYLIKDDALVRVAAAGPPELEFEGGQAPLALDGNTLVAASARAGAPIHWEPSRPGTPAPSAPSMKAALAVPFKSAAELRGVMEVSTENAASITEHDRLALLTLADLLGMALHNAHLYKGMEELAMVDSLTGLPNRRAIMASTELEFERAQRYQRSLTILSIDVDNFKGINDNNGHPTGDRALQGVAGVIQEATRRVDFCGRVGGDEFLVVLPETDQERALVVAERIRRACARLGLNSDGDEPVAVTVSVGIVSLPETHADELRELLGAVDQALYRAKEDGRNRISV